MTWEEYFGDWFKVIDPNELSHIVKTLEEKYKTTYICPDKNNIFKAFKVCPYKSLKIVFVGMDPYAQKDRATGVLFGNSDRFINNISPSLQIIKNSAINFEVPHKPIIFDHSLESWAAQGVLMLNSALTVELNKTGSHTMLWRPFISKLLYNLSRKEFGIVYVLFGETAQTFEPYIDKHNYIIKEKHPAWYHRSNKSMPSKLFKDIDDLCFKQNKCKIKWYEEQED